MNEKQTILLVDNSKNDLLRLDTALKAAGFRNPIREVYDGEEAIAYLNGTGRFENREEFPIPVFILLDLDMPRKNGFDVLRWLQTQPELKRLPTIILTTSIRLGDIDLAYHFGANSFLIKPSDLSELITILKCLREWLKVNQMPSLQGWANESSALREVIPVQRSQKVH